MEGRRVMAQGQFVKVYHVLVDEFPEVWESDRLLSSFVRALYVADKFWPQWAPIPDRKSFLTLVEKGLCLLNETQTGFKVRGLDKERSARSEHGKRAASIRWSNAAGNAQLMPSRAEQSRADSARASNGDALFMGFKPRPTVDKEAERRTIERMKRETDEELYRRHPELRPT